MNELVRFFLKPQISGELFVLVLGKIFIVEKKKGTGGPAPQRNHLRGENTEGTDWGQA